MSARACRRSYEKNLSATTALKIEEHSLELSPGMQGFAQEAISMIVSNFSTYDPEVFELRPLLYMITKYDY